MGGAEEFTSWIRQHYARLTYIAFTYVHNQSQAEDIVQESFVKAYSSIQQLKDLSRPFPWLVRIVINECYTVMRRKKRESPVETMPEQTSVSTEDIYMQHADNQEVYRAVMSLPEKYRTPIILFYFEDLSIREIGDVLGLGEGAVKTRLSRGRERLKELLLERGEPNELRNTHSARQA